MAQIRTETLEGVAEPQEIAVLMLPVARAIPGGIETRDSPVPSPRRSRAGT
ncbi:hypothetical protein [Hoeflea sp.]|uniref:hypothetical protein n=1 Tax=Hoeflea sp. TaxID=1940281 RepID=UPI003B02A3D8